VSSVVEAFAVDASMDDVTTRLDPETFQRRQETLLEADRLLDNIKVRSDMEDIIPAI
jgi:hypothetical protein